MIDQAEKTNADTVYCGLTRKLSDLRKNYNDVIVKIQDQQTAMYNMMINMPRFGFYCYLYRREIVETNHLYFDENTKFGEDREFLWKYLCHCQQVAYVDQNLYGYRVTPNSAMQGKATWRNVDLMYSLDRVSAYYESKKCPFLTMFQSYVYPRSAWSIAKEFAIKQERELFCRFAEEFGVKAYMRHTAKNDNKLVALSSMLYLLHKDIFYFVISSIARMRVFL